MREGGIPEGSRCAFSFVLVVFDSRGIEEGEREDRDPCEVAWVVATEIAWYVSGYRREARWVYDERRKKGEGRETRPFLPRGGVGRRMYETPFFLEEVKNNRRIFGRESKNIRRIFGLETWTIPDVVDPPGGPQVGRFDFDGGEFWHSSIFSILKKDGMVRLSRSRTSKYRLEVPPGPAFVAGGAGCRRPTRWTSSWSFRFR